MEKVTHHPLLELTVNMLKNEQGNEQILQELTNKGLSQEQVDGLLKMAKKIIHDRKFKTGMTCIGIGSTLLLFSFLIALFSNYSDVFFVWGLYGLTGIGGILLFAGLIYMLS